MILVLNLKNYLKSEKDYLILVKKLKKLKANFWIAVNPYFYYCLIKKLKKTNFKIGLQNLAPISNKPQTGEIIYDFELVNLADFILIGHSERYRLGENKKIILEKIKTLQDKKLRLLIFFSENSYRPKIKFSQVQKQTEENLKDFLAVINKKNYKKIYFVYEPWWAISSERGKIPEKKFLEDLIDWYKNNLGLKFPILYGGSYNSEMAKKYRDLKFDGYVLGKASTNINDLKILLKTW
jgi:triosephosphate isomerase